jgi:hypothetical protein
MDQFGRVVVNEPVVGRLGAALGGPVGRVVLMHTLQELISLELSWRTCLHGLPMGRNGSPAAPTDSGLITLTSPPTGRASRLSRFCMAGYLLEINN